MPETCGFWGSLRKGSGVSARFARVRPVSKLAPALRERTEVARTRYFRDLVVWQKAMELAREVYLRTEDFPRSETFGLRMQMRRSAVSVASNIAEGHGKLTDADLGNRLALREGHCMNLKRRMNWRAI